MIRRTIPILLIVAMVSGCGFFTRTKSSFYSLDTIPSISGVTAIGGLPIGVEAIELPPGLDRRGIVVRERNHRLEIRETEQWADSLESMVLHTLAFNLASRLPEGMVVLPGEAKPDGGMRSLYLIVEELAGGPERAVVLDARWTLRPARPGSPELARHERIAIDIGSLDSSEIAAGMSQALAILADRIVASLATS
jgi:uncharacterized lipoprotein YmbA